MEGIDHLNYPPQRLTFQYGMNTDWGSDSLLPGQCQEIKNCNINAYGRLTVRGGTRLLNTSQVGTTPILDMYRYYKANGSKDLLIHVDNDLYTINTSNGTTSAKLATLPTSTPLRWITWNDRAYGFGGDTYFKWDGSTATKISSSNAPDLTCGAVHGDKLFGFAENSANPNRLYYSATLDGETWGATDFLLIRDDDGDVGKDVIEVSGGTLLALKSTSAWLVDGSSIYDFSRVVESDQVGMLGYTLSGYDGAAIWLSQQGVCFWDPRSPKQFNIISRHEINKELFDNNSFTVLDKSYGHYSPKTRRYYLAVNSSTHPRTYVFHFDFAYRDAVGELRVPCTYYIWPIDIGPVISFDGKGDNGELYMGGADNGWAYQADTTAVDKTTANASADIDIVFQTEDSDYGIDEKKKLRSIDQLAKTNGGLSCSAVLDFGRKSIPKTLNYVQAGGVFDTGLFNTATFGGGELQNKVAKFTKAKFLHMSYKVTASVGVATELSYPKIKYHPLTEIKNRSTS